MESKMTYDRYDIVFQEIPNEISLAFTIEGCPNNCLGCHSPHLRQQNGKILNENELLDVLNKYNGTITCVLFLGGDAFHDEIFNLSLAIKQIGYKVAMYSGNDFPNGKLFTILDYYKIGSYNHELGGLDSKTTNQKLFKIEDITHKL